MERSEHPRARVGGPRVGRGLRWRQGSWGRRGSSRAPTGNRTIEHQGQLPLHLPLQHKAVFAARRGSRACQPLRSVTGGCGSWVPPPCRPRPFQGFAEHRPLDLHQLEPLHHGPCAPCVPGTRPERSWPPQADRPLKRALHEPSREHKATKFRCCSRGRPTRGSWGPVG